MRRLFSKFEETEVFIEKGQSVESFMPLLRIDNTGMKPECFLASVDYLESEVAPKLFEAHWQEVGQDKSWRVDIHWQYYRQLESLNMLRAVVLKLGNEPVGYFLFVISPSLHYKTKQLASSDMFYLMPEHRAKYAVRLFRAAEAYAKAAGADKMYIAFKIYKDILPLTKRLGFAHVENVVVKSLE